MDTEYGATDADLRYRYETVEQDNMLKDAKAHTLHARLGFTTKAWNDFTFSIQGEAVTVIGGEDYNSGPGGNGNSAFSVIPDPEGEEVNQLWLAYGGLPDTTVKLGRQRIIYDNARFVGNVGWRQNEQTFDGLTVVNKSLANTIISYAYLTEVHSIFFQDKELEKAHLLNVSYALNPSLHLGGYAYYLDYEPAMGADQRTLGLSAKGQLFKTNAMTATYKLEYARQSDYADSAMGYELDYSVAELGVRWGVFNAKAGVETLEGDGASAFMTPLATLHAFNGWADQFLKTPATGLVDRYAGISSKVAKVKLALQYHDFVADKGSMDYGTEWDVSAGFSPYAGWSLLLKFADYTATDKGVDTEKLWVQAAYQFN
jgi:hypothetical protein